MSFSLTERHQIGGVNTVIRRLAIVVFDCPRDGFPNLTPAEFLELLCKAVQRGPPAVRARSQLGRLEPAPLAEYMLGPVGSTHRYTTQGPLRGPCGHKHKDIESAVDCLDADDAICVERGGHTDRTISVIGPGGKRELNVDERTAVSLYRGASKQ